MQQYLLVFVLGFSSATTASVICQVVGFGRVSYGTAIMSWLSLMAAVIASLIWLRR